MKAAVATGNRTGISRAPDLGRAMLAATEEFPPSSDGDAAAIGRLRAEIARGSEPLGTMPSPASARDLARRALRAITGGGLGPLLDRLGERLAFEAAGTRLYDAILSKHDAGRGFRGGPSREDLEHIRDEEHAHFRMLAEAITELGDDSTVTTPSADLQATASKGLPAVLADPRTDVLQCLEALLVAELVDNDCWPALIELAEKAGQDALAERFGEALESEREHLERVRSWVAAGTDRSAERARNAAAGTQREPVRGAARGKARKQPRHTSAKRSARGSATGKARTGAAKARRARPAAKGKHARSRSRSSGAGR